MRYMVLVKATARSEAGELPADREFEAMGNFNEQMVKAGVMLAGEGLHPSSQGVRLKFSSGARAAVTDGPFTETKELVAGFWIIQVKSKEEAIEWLSRAPFERGEEIELRRIYEMEDFGPAMTDELKAQEKRLRSKL